MKEIDEIRQRAEKAINPKTKEMGRGIKRTNKVYFSPEVVIRLCDALDLVIEDGVVWRTGGGVTLAKISQILKGE